MKSLFDMVVAKMNNWDLATACKIEDIKIRVENIIDTNRKLEIFGYAITIKDERQYITIGTPDRYLKYRVSSRGKIKSFEYHYADLTIKSSENMTTVQRIVAGLKYRVVTSDDELTNELTINRRLIRMSIDSDDFCERIGIFTSGNMISYDYRNYTDLRFYSLILCKCGKIVYESEVNGRHLNPYECNWIENSLVYCDSCSR